MTGCAHFHPQPLFPLEILSAFEARSLDSPGLKQFLEENLPEKLTPWPPQQWDFSMLTLAALYYHSDLHQAYAKWETANAAIISAGARPNPSVGFSPQFNASAASGLSPWTYGFTFDIPVETMGKRGRRIAHARHLSEAARLNVATMAWQVRSRLRISFLNFYSTRQTGEILKKQRAVQEETLRLLEDRQARGGASLLDMTQARIAFEQTSLLSREAQKQNAEAWVKLADALGLPVSALERINLSFDSLDSYPHAAHLNSKDVRRQALAGRADILGALAEYAASESSLKLEIARQYPDIHLGPGYSWDQGQNKWAVGVNITLPVLNHNQGPVAEAKARREEARAKFEGLQSKVIAEIDSTLAGYQFALQKLETADSLVDAQQEKYQSLQAMLKTGEAARMALLNAQLELDSAMLSRLSAFLEVQQSLGLLQDALQSPADFLSSLPEKSNKGQKKVANQNNENKKEAPIESESRGPFESSQSTVALDPEAQVKSGIISRPLENGFIPASAVVWAEGKAWVYVEKDSGHFFRREISTEKKAKDGGFIGRDFSAGDKVVVTGGQMLLSEEFRSQIKEDEG